VLAEPTNMRPGGSFVPLNLTNAADMAMLWTDESVRRALVIAFAVIPRAAKLRSQRDINLWRIPLQLSLVAAALFGITLIPDILDKYGVPAYCEIQAYFWDPKDGGWYILNRVRKTQNGNSSLSSSFRVTCQEAPCR
jgi:hypothetical protein